LAAAKLIPTQLSRNPANLKKATREMALSSCSVLEEAKMDLRTVGVTGIRREGLGGG